jgi:hypothetical protein
VLSSIVFRIAVPVLTHEFFSAETVMEVIFFCQFSFRQADTVAFTILVWFCGWSLNQQIVGRRILIKNRVNVLTILQNLRLKMLDLQNMILQ